MKLSPGQCKWLAVGLLLIALSFVVALVAIPAMMLHRHYDDAIDDLTVRLEKYQRIISQTPAVRAEIARIEALRPRRFYLKGSTEALSASEIQDLVKGIVETKGGKVASIQPLSPKTEGNYRRIGVTVQANASILGIQHALYAIETMEPYLFVESVTVRAGQGRLYRPLPGVQPEFGVQMNVYGYAVVKK